MFTIGDFATFTQVSVPALRLWDSKGLLTPAWLEARDLRPAGGAAEVSLAWDPEHPDRNVTELHLAIAGEG